MTERLVAQAVRRTLGVDSWRRWLTDRITAAINAYDVDGYFLDIVGGWVNNTRACCRP